MITLFQKNELPVWLQYPPEYLWVVRKNLVELEPWFMMDRDEITRKKQGLEKRCLDSSR